MHFLHYIHIYIYIYTYIYIHIILYSVQFCSVLRYVMLHTFWHHFRLWLIPFRFLVSESCAQTGKGPKASTLARAKACHVQEIRDSFIMFYPPTRSSLHSACPKSLSWFEDGRIMCLLEMQLKWPPSRLLQLSSPLFNLRVWRPDSAGQRLQNTPTFWDRLTVNLSQLC